MSLHILNERRSKLGADLKAMIVDHQSGRELTAADEQAYKDLTDAFEAADQAVTSYMQKEADKQKLEERLSKPLHGFSYGGFNAAQAQGAQNNQQQQPGTKQLTEAEARLQSYSRFIKHGVTALTEVEQRSMRVDDPAKGGFWVAPQEMAQGLIKNLDDVLFLRQICTVNPALAKAESIGVPTMTADYTDFTWTGELSVPSEDDSLRVGKREMYPHKLTKLIKVSRELLLRSTIDPVAFMNSRVAYRLARIMEYNYLYGTGDKQPLGMLTASSDGIDTDRDITSASAGAVPDIDKFFDAVAAIKQGYQANLKALFHRQVVAAYRKKKDSQNQYLWQPSVQAGTPETLAGIPILKSDLMPSAAANNVYFGIVADFKALYMIQDALTLQQQRLEEAFYATREIGFLTEFWSDGAPVLSEASSRLKGGS